MAYRMGHWLKRNLPYLLLTAAVFACTSWLAANLNIEMCPDEAARTPLAWFIYRNGTLPTGWEESIRIATWGFSYGFSPYLTSIVGSLFMRICSIFTTDRSALLFSIRLASVIPVTLAAFFTCKLAEALFEDWRAALLAGIIVGATPQVLYLGGYHNCDSLALFSVTLIVYSWCKAWRAQTWSVTNLVLTGAGISLCLLSYYNAYPFILFSILFYMISSTMFGMRWVEILEGFLLVLCVVMALAGWYFVRNAALYEGDVFGLKMREKYGEAFATVGFRPSDRVTPKGIGMTVTDMLFVDTTFSQRPWLRYMLQSFFCMTGYMTEPLPFWCEIGYYGV
ncbi:MAG: glycosyltransferase family 39 protein, partial [Coriobacteriales bacterium]|nr:glycosyltransferase family 39 protein [Coriobacteriales bacterium]